ncbi:helix-turn-helix domain-containing protein [Qipengyuania sphaerica]|uniref:helix-turn-helix domain-containing protein n=1 Tax=Qipengyuania sphaerica TaxID=2867243 RepID=UPI001C884049|nr:helix-turn-helix domain-containing protein [Qipengyuania sphaerica]MBX7541398.1 helix-turn-helix domain-containing protein [Qipengyuania sphaerica]
MSGDQTVTAEYKAGPLSLRLLVPSGDLAPYISSYYRTDVEEGAIVDDWLPPEESNLRVGRADVYEAAIGEQSLTEVPPAIVSGPTDRVTRLRIGGGSFWGIGLTPAGWSRLVRLPASEYANRFVNTHATALDPSIVTMLDRLLDDGEDLAAARDMLNEGFRAVLGNRPASESTIHAVHLRLLSEDMNAVAPIATMAGMTPRTFERFCKRHFGFPARALLKRQRFLRSLGKYMLDPSMNWISALDTHYWDQAHFIRDFRATMGMKPGEYAALDHPIVRAAVSVTNQNAGVAHQALYRPEASNGDATGV